MSEVRGEVRGRFRIHFSTLYGEHETVWKPVGFHPGYPPALVELQRPERGLQADDGIWYGHIQRAWVEYERV